MPLITFKPSGKTIEVSRNELLQAARDAASASTPPAGRKRLLREVHSHVLSGNIESDSLGVLRRPRGRRLCAGCKTKVLSDPVSWTCPSKSEKPGGRFTKPPRGLRPDQQELLPERYEYEPLTINGSSMWPAPGRGRLSDYDRLCRLLRDSGANARSSAACPCSKKSQMFSGKKDGAVTFTIIYDRGIYLIDIQPAHHGTSLRDRGGHRNDHRGGGARASVPWRGDFREERLQRPDRMRLDVISRINYARKPERLEELRKKSPRICEPSGSRRYPRRTMSRFRHFAAVLSGNNHDDPTFS